MDFEIGLGLINICIVGYNPQQQTNHILYVGPKVTDQDQFQIWQGKVYRIKQT